MPDFKSFRRRSGGATPQQAAPEQTQPLDCVSAVVVRNEAADAAYIECALASKGLLVAAAADSCRQMGRCARRRERERAVQEAARDENFMAEVKAKPVQRRARGK